MAKKQHNNSFNGAALALCITPDELQKRLDAHNKVQDLQVERDRAINAATTERERLQKFATAVRDALEPLENGGKLSKEKVKMALQYAQNIELITL
jgi:hypothetical protein